MEITSSSHHFHTPNISSTLHRCQEFVSCWWEKVKIHSHRVPPLYLVLLRCSWRRHKHLFPKSQDPRQLSSLTERRLSTEWLNERCHRKEERKRERQDVRYWICQEWKSERTTKRLTERSCIPFPASRSSGRTHTAEKRRVRVRVCKREREKGQTMLKRRIRTKCFKTFGLIE